MLILQRHKSLTSRYISDLNLPKFIQIVHLALQLQYIFTWNRHFTHFLNCNWLVDISSGLSLIDFYNPKRDHASRQDLKFGKHEPIKINTKGKHFCNVWLFESVSYSILGSLVKQSVQIYERDPQNDSYNQQLLESNTIMF